MCLVNIKEVTCTYFWKSNLKKVNTVCNFLLDAIERELKLLACYNIKYIYFLMDTVARTKIILYLGFYHYYVKATNRNPTCISGSWSLLLFLRLKFWLVWTEKKKIETIETVEDYISINKNAKNPPFIVNKRR